MIDRTQLDRFFEARDPWLRRMLECAFRDLYGARRLDAAADAYGLTYDYVLRCVLKGRVADADDLVRYVRRSMHFAILATRDGRAVDKKSASRRHMFPDPLESDRREGGQAEANALLGSEGDPAEIAALRVDFADFLSSLTYRQKLILLDMAAGEDNSTLVDRYGVSASRVSQLRRRFVELWNEFTDL